ncbi:glycosyltransferase [Ornithinimicrobium sp. Y1847]|uniref:glycosyltransferase n=1 Tax=Ornithinimicrobium sp. Y1847 TaxID=3405419 RepID=UPI003B68408D
MKRVRIIIPVFNTGEYLETCLRSARAQTFPSIEIVLVDDGSTDAVTLDLLRRFESEGDVILVRQPNKGPSAAINAGLAGATTEYFFPLGSDDLIAPDYIAEAVEVMDADPSIGVTYSRARLFSDADGIWGLPDFEWKTFLVHNMIFACSLFRTSDWASVGGYDESMRNGREDHDFVMKILGLGRTPYRLDAVHFFYRIRPGSVNAEVGSDRQKLISAHADIFRNNIGVYETHAEDLFAFVFSQHDEIMDLRHRYALLERFRTSSPRALKAFETIRAVARRGRNLLSAESS